MREDAFERVKFDERGAEGPPGGSFAAASSPRRRGPTLSLFRRLKWIPAFRIPPCAQRLRGSISSRLRGNDAAEPRVAFDFMPLAEC